MASVLNARLSNWFALTTQYPYASESRVTFALRRLLTVDSLLLSHLKDKLGERMSCEMWLYPPFFAMTLPLKNIESVVFYCYNNGSIAWKICSLHTGLNLKYHYHNTSYTFKRTTRTETPSTTLKIQDKVPKNIFVSRYLAINVSVFCTKQYNLE